MILGGLFDLDSKIKRVEEINNLMLASSFWDDRISSEKLVSELKHDKNIIDNINNLESKINSNIDMLNDVKDSDTEMLLLIEEDYYDINKLIDKATLDTYLSGEYDNSNAIMEIHAGAGGTEACDWANMLLRMYLRWCERHGFKSEVLDLLEDEGGIKSATVRVSGAYAFGYLKGEAGVHRLVRISPFDAQKRRHTSFTSVYASPVIDDDIEIELKPEDYRLDTYRAGGAGGQHVNKTDSAVRITHYATGIVVQCQNERSQFMNKDVAFKMLRSRLYEYYQKQREEEHQKDAIAKKDIAWGSQIRSYVFQPYTMVKDHRTGVQVGNINAVMDGDLDDFIESYLNWNKEQNG